MGGAFVIAVLLLAAMTFLGWWLMEPAAAVDRAVSLLIVACPCALALATPLAISVALIRAARQRILIKGGDVLQALARPGVLWLDKSGTLTQGNLRVVCWHGERSLFSAIAAVQAHSTHPVAAAMSRYVQEQSVNHAGYATASDVQQSECGIHGRYGSRRIDIGNQRFFESRGLTIGEELLAESRRLLDQGLSPVFVAADGQCQAVAGVGDPLRHDAAESIRQLRKLGWQVGILSGDHQAIVDDIARRLAIPAPLARGQLLPEDKVRIIQDSQSVQEQDRRHHSTVMVGDGVNDSAALAIATVGIAAHRGAEASLAAAPVYLAGEGLNRLVRLMHLAQATMNAIQRNLIVSLGYNLVAVALAAAGWITPLAAAILMPVSSLTVVGLSFVAPMRKEDESRPADAQVAD
jgi:Cu2+-exporting ATPase